ncbi:hypothetical protein [Candidatus Avelusimicrobium sp.]|uniref:hypothetical protein n=1 Tax=Candidatus Avelusimicrobium sp. TaxID=3048833 RepID=UPI003D7CFAC7
MKKLFVLFTALMLSTAAFAANASSNSALIEESVAAGAQAAQEGEVDQQTLKNTQQALQLGLLIFDAHRDLKQMTDTDKAIEKALEKDIPAAFNKIKTTSDEVADEVEPLLRKLSSQLIANQPAYPKTAVDEETATFITFITAITYTQGKGLLNETAAAVLNGELQAIMLQGMLPQGE